MPLAKRQPQATFANVLWGFVGCICVLLGVLWTYNKSTSIGGQMASSDQARGQHQGAANVATQTDQTGAVASDHTAQQVAFEQTRLGQSKPYDDAMNEIQKSAIFIRANAQMQAYWASHGANFSDWKGRLSSSVTSHGGSEVDIEITSDAGAVYRESNISKGSALYDDLATLPDGAKVVFSGSFTDADSATDRERSLTEKGSLDEPTFNVDLSSVERADRQEAFAPPEVEQQISEAVRNVDAPGNANAVSSNSDVTTSALPLPDAPSTELQKVIANTSGPSFDCSTATNLTARAICGNERLSQLDRQMAILYYSHTDYTMDSAVRDRQRDWIHHRNQSCVADVVCLTEQFNQRITELQ